MINFDDYLFSECNVPLFHYTGINSLLSIVNKKSLWLGNVNYMNDSNEIVYAAKILEGLISDLEKSNKDDTLVSKFLFFLRGFLGEVGISHFNVFVFSLSEEKNLLSQWRSYTPYGKGVNLHFNKTVINNLIEKNNFKIGKCLYKRHEQRNLLNDFLKRSINFINENRSFFEGIIFEETNLADLLFQIFCLIKDESFSEEKEWRLISSFYPLYRSPEIKYREGASMLIPYLEIKLDSENCLFENVTIGPTTHPGLAMSSLSEFLFYEKACSSVSQSGIPYREWK